MTRPHAAWLVPHPLSARLAAALDLALALSYVAVVFGPVLVLAVAGVAQAYSGWHGLGPFTSVPGAAGRTGAGSGVLDLWPPERWTLLARSIALAAAAAGLAGLVGALVATVLSRFRRGRGAALRWLVLVLAPIPAYVHALAWASATIALDARLGDRLGRSLELTGPGGVIWVQAMAMLPLAVALSLLAIETVSRELIDAGRMHAGAIEVLRRVTLPLAAPLLLAGAGVVFVISLLDYSVAALFQVNVYSLAVFADYSVSNDPVRALVTAVPMMAVAGLVVAVSQRGLRRVAHRPERRASAPGPKPPQPLWFTAAQAAACSVLVAQIAVPLVALVRATGSVRQLSYAVGAADREIWFSLVVAAAAAVACVPLAAAAARRLQRSDGRSRAWWLLVTAPLAVPAPLVGIGLIMLWNRPAVPGVYGSAAMPVLAGLARFTPFAAVIVAAQMRRIDPLLIEAARVHGDGGLRSLVAVRLPLLLPGLAAAACVTFALTLGELGATLLVTAPGDQTLTMRIYNYLHYGASDAVAGLCLAMAVAAVAATVLALIGLSVLPRLRIGSLVTAR